MNRLVLWCKIAIVSIGAFTGLERSAAAQSSKPAPCAAPEYHQFDFWVGDWDTFDMDNLNTVVARNHVSRILDGCVLLEDYSQSDGHHGQSFSIYDATRGLWHQSWVTNRGELLIIEGEFHKGAIVLSGVNHTLDGKGRQVRGTWKPESGGVRETAVTSVDGGKTWQTWFDIIFRPHTRRDLTPRPARSNAE